MAKTVRGQTSFSLAPPPFPNFEVNFSPASPEDSAVQQRHQYKLYIKSLILGEDAGGNEASDTLILTPMRL